MKMISTFALFLLVTFHLRAQLPAEQDLYMRAVKSHRYKDYGTFLPLMQKLDSMRPNTLRYTYDLACAYAVNGQPEKALDFLKRALLMDNSKDIEQNPELMSLRALPGFASLVRLREHLSEIKKTSQAVLTLDEKDLHPEGLCYLKKQKIWLAGSIRHGKIVSFDKSGTCTDWIKLKYAVFAIRPDADEKFLWAATTGVPEQKGYVRSLERKSQIVKIDIKSRKVVDSITVPGSHIFGDLAVSRDGTVYVSDSDSPMVLKITGKNFSPWLFLEGRIFNLQGLAFNADESALYVSDYNSGILRVSVSDPSDRQWLDMPEGFTARGIDGLTYYDNSLIAVHNGVKPIRIVRYFLDGSGKKIDSAGILDNNRPEFDEPALGAIKDGDFYFFANAPWNAYDRRKENLDDSKFSNPVLMRCPL